METWFTSDTHFGHARIMEYCPGRAGFLGIAPDADVPTMNAALAESLNRNIAPEDRVIFLGDFAMGKIETSLAFLTELNGTWDMFWGNHDRPHYCNFKDAEWESWKPGGYDKHLKWVQAYADAGFHTQRLDGFHDFGDGVTAQLCHFPYSGDSGGEDRYTGFRPEDSGMVLVHGHVHDVWTVRGRQINVGFDAWGRPLHESEVKALVQSAYAAS